MFNTCRLPAFANLVQIKYGATEKHVSNRKKPTLMLSVHNNKGFTLMVAVETNNYTKKTGNAFFI